MNNNICCLEKMLSFPSKKGNILCRLPILPNSAGIMKGVLERPGGFTVIGVAPITQLCTCVIEIETFKGGHLKW